MANQPNQVATQQQKRDVTAPVGKNFRAMLDANYKDQIVSLLGNDGDYEEFASVVMMAISRDPELLNCTPQSMIQSCLACASDRLKPDGRQATLVRYGNTAQYLPMIGGVVLSLMRTGLVKDIQVDVVYRGEHFVNVQGSESYIEHRPGLDRGDDADIVGAYAVIKTVTGGEFKRAMGRKQLDKVRNIAKSKNVWNAWADQMYMKTVLRNLSKLLPKELQLPVLSRDDSMYDLSKSQAAPVTRTVELTHKPQDIIEPDAPVSPPPPPERQKEPQSQNGERTRNDAAKTAERSQNVSQIDLDDDLPPHIRDAPPIEGEVVDPPASDNVDDDDFPGDRPSSTQDAPQHRLTSWAISQLAAVKTWTEASQLLAKLWAHEEYADFVASGGEKDVYNILTVMPVWREADQSSPVYRRVVKG